MLLKRVGSALGRAIQSPLTTRAVRGARVVADVAGMAGVPMASGLAKGLGIAEKALKGLQEAV
jgi:hypothetical protein